MRQPQDFTVSEYLALDRASERKFEYIDGALRLLAGGSGNHSLVALNLAATLRELLRSQTCRMFNSDMRVKLSVSGMSTQTSRSPVTHASNSTMILSTLRWLSSRCCSLQRSSTTKRRSCATTRQWKAFRRSFWCIHACSS